ncbi:MAG: hypothetical protein MRY51_02800 [Flavobacteriaceae bacterium]|nr:hypothetical protein [Flavobacteriaceae bacterium]MCI5089172.1 hypothetical protein [Flavobacteriaceae bacterium]CAI8186490.1 MAG: Uncharacterised protein [SAR116 cluster bacterium]
MNHNILSLTSIYLNTSNLTDPKNKLELKKLKKLLKLLSERPLESPSISLINREIGFINALRISDSKQFKKALQKSLRTILKHLETTYKWVPEKHYQNLWLALGMSCFGVPFGVFMGSVLGSMTFNGGGLTLWNAHRYCSGNKHGPKSGTAGQNLIFV